MRRSKVLMAVVSVSVLLVAGCGSDGDDDGGGGSEITTAAELKAAIEGAGASCDEPETITEEDAFEAFAPREGMECELDGQDLGAFLFDDDASLAEGLEYLEWAYCEGMGVEGFPHLTDGLWVIGADAEGDRLDSAVAALEKVSDAVGAEVQGKECPDGPSSEPAGEDGSGE